MKYKIKTSEGGYTIIELILAIVILPIIVIGISNAYGSVRQSYMTSRQLNEMYAVLSACPELDRALEFNSLNASNNCFPNNTFITEGAGTSTTVYTPQMTVTSTSDLPNGDALKTVPDSKVVDIQVSSPTSTAPPLQLRMLVTRNGVGQL